MMAETKVLLSSLSLLKILFSLYFIFVEAWIAGNFSDGEEGVDDEDEYKKSEGQGDQCIIDHYKNISSIQNVHCEYLGRNKRPKPDSDYVPPLLAKVNGNLEVKLSFDF